MRHGSPLEGTFGLDLDDLDVGGLDGGRGAELVAGLLVPAATVSPADLDKAGRALGAAAADAQDVTRVDVAGAVEPRVVGAQGTLVDGVGVPDLPARVALLDAVPALAPATAGSTHGSAVLDVLLAPHAAAVLVMVMVVAVVRAVVVVEVLHLAVVVVVAVAVVLLVVVDVAVAAVVTVAAVAVVVVVIMVIVVIVAVLAAVVAVALYVAVFVTVVAVVMTVAVMMVVVVVMIVEAALVAAVARVPIVVLALPLGLARPAAVLGRALAAVVDDPIALALTRDFQHGCNINLANVDRRLAVRLAVDLRNVAALLELPVPVTAAVMMALVVAMMAPIMVAAAMMVVEVVEVVAVVVVMVVMVAVVVVVVIVVEVAVAAAMVALTVAMGNADLLANVEVAAAVQPRAVAAEHVHLDAVVVGDAVARVTEADEEPLALALMVVVVVIVVRVVVVVVVLMVVVVVMMVVVVVVVVVRRVGVAARHGALVLDRLGARRRLGDGEAPRNGPLVLDRLGARLPLVLGGRHGHHPRVRLLLGDRLPLSDAVRRLRPPLAATAFATTTAVILVLILVLFIWELEAAIPVTRPERAPGGRRSLSGVTSRGRGNTLAVGSGKPGSEQKRGGPHLVG